MLSAAPVSAIARGEQGQREQGKIFSKQRPLCHGNVDGEAFSFFHFHVGATCGANRGTEILSRGCPERAAPKGACRRQGELTAGAGTVGGVVLAGDEEADEATCSSTYHGT